jgi:hypothetical protein
VRAGRLRSHSQPPELGAELRCASGQVHGLRPESLHPADDPIGDLPGHDLLSSRSRTDVAVAAGLVAELSQVELEGTRSATPQLEAVLAQDP